jgi:putative PEP-CTERM system TPR-repeat lipoprotein
MPSVKWRPLPIRRPLPALLLAACLGLGTAAGAASDPKAARFYEDALARYEKNDLDGAIIQLKNALQIDKRQLAVQLLLGKALMSKGDIVGAEVAFVEALNLGVNREEVVLLLGRSALMLGRPKDLLELPRFSEAGLPSHLRITLLVVKATAAMQLADPRTALRYLEDARAIDATSLEPWVAEVPIRVRTRQLPQAVAAAEKAMALAPRSSEAVYQRASVDHALGDRKAAIAGYGRALGLDALHVEARLARAGLYIDDGKLEEAQADLVELQKAAPNEPRSDYLRSVILERSGDRAGRDAALRRITALIDPLPLDYVRYRPQQLLLNGLAHFTLGARDNAKPYLEAFYRQNGPGAAQKVLAQIYLAEGNPDNAVEMLEGYLRAFPGDPQALSLLATAHMAKGRHARAINLLQEALRSSDRPEFHAVLGLSLLRTGQKDAAQAQLESAYRKDPDQIGAATALAALHLQNGQVAKAQTLAEALVKRAPKNITLHNLLGVVKQQRRDFPGARAAFDQALSLEPNSRETKLHLVRLELAQGRYGPAESRLNELLKANENSIEVLMTMATVAETQGKRVETLRWLAKAVDVSAPQELRPGMALADLHMRSGQPDQALQAARAVVSKAPDSVDALLLLTRCLIEAGDLTNARLTAVSAGRAARYDADQLLKVGLLQVAAADLPAATYTVDKVLADKPNLLPAQALMADIELRRGEASAAEARARLMVKKHPTSAIGHLLLGDVARHRKQLAAATEAYRRAHQIEPSTETVQRLLQVLSAQNNLGGAASLAQQWLKATPRDVVTQRSLATVHLRMNNLAGAKAAYQAILAVTPNDRDALNNLANVLLKTRDPGALAAAEKALAAYPTVPTVIDTAGWAALHAGQTERALSLLRDARLRSPAHPEIRFHLGMALAKAGRTAEARQELQAALAGGRPFEGRDEAEKALQTLR